MQRRVGLAALERHTQNDTSYATLSSQISAQQLTSFQTQLVQFRSALQTFATTHRKTIASDPTFRAQFQAMCAAIGVDPLAGPLRSSGISGGWWAESLGFLNDWTYELAVQIVDVCASTRDINGGLIEMDELIRLLRKLRGLEGEQRISTEDVVRSIKTLEPLSSGYTVIDLDGGRKAVRSVVKELDKDLSAIISLAGSNGGCVTVDLLCLRLGWTDGRARAALESASRRDGMCWVDEQTSSGVEEYWVPATLKWD